MSTLPGVIAQGESLQPALWGEGVGELVAQHDFRDLGLNETLANESWTPQYLHPGFSNITCTAQNGLTLKGDGNGAAWFNDDAGLNARLQVNVPYDLGDHPQFEWSWIMTPDNYVGSNYYAQGGWASFHQISTWQDRAAEGTQAAWPGPGAVVAGTFPWSLMGSSTYLGGEVVTQRVTYGTGHNAKVGMWHHHQSNYSAWPRGEYSDAEMDGFTNPSWFRIWFPASTDKVRLIGFRLLRNCNQSTVFPI